MNNAGIYWNDKLVSPIPFLKKEQFKSHMKALIDSQNNLLHQSQYILKPVFCTSSIKLKRKGKFDLADPKQIICALIDKIHLHINESQLKQIIQWKQRTEIFRIRKKYRIYRPIRSTPREDPLKFWKFLYEATVQPIRKKIQAKNLTWLTNRRKNRLEYMKLWKEKLLNPKKKVNILYNGFRLYVYFIIRIFLDLMN